MTKYLILNEKNSAMRNFASALGGSKGHFGNFDYQLVAARGHLMTLANPQDQWDDPTFQERVKQWSNTQTIPWHLERFNWNKTYIVGMNYRTKRKESTKSLVDNIKKLASGCDAIVIATDDDPSGEGDVLGQEIIDKIAWKGTVLRCRFADESKKSIEQALNKLEDVTNKTNNHKYQKGLARERFDYATMQMSRLATQFTREHNYDVLVTPGRLKSTIIELIYQQTRKRDSFTPQDQYQAIFIDDTGTKFINRDLPKYDTETLAGNDLTQLTPSTVTVGDAKRKFGKAPKLMNFAQLGIALSKTHVPLKKIIQTYQQMYEAGYASYPRTEDSVMTVEQWHELLNIAKPIAQVVGVDPSLLVQTEPRSSYVSKKELAHGANRPGLTVPSSLKELSDKFGTLGAQIYTTLAKSYLATLAPDYEYDMTKAFITDFPKFTATKNVPVKPGYKAILQDLENTGKDDDDKDDSATQFGKNAKPDINVTQTTMPQKPNRKFVLNYLNKNNVGTGATQVQTLSGLMDGKRPVIKEVKSQLVLTPEGVVAGAMMQDTMLSSPRVTKQLNDMAGQVGDGKIPLDNIYKAVNMIITKDRQTMEKNADRLDKDSYLNGKLPPKSGNSAAKFHGKYKGGEEVSFKKIFMGHRFTKEEADALLAGETIKIDVKTKFGKKDVTGDLEENSFTSKKDHKKIKYWGFTVKNWG